MEIAPVQDHEIDDGEAYDVKLVADRAKSWALASAPPGMTIDPKSGRVTWKAVYDPHQSSTITAVARGPKGVVAERSWNLKVKAVKPEFEGGKDRDYLDGHNYEFKPKLSRGSKYGLTWRLSRGPGSMRCDADTGKLTWKARYRRRDPLELRVVEVVLVATNGGGECRRKWKITVDPFVTDLEEIPDQEIPENAKYEQVIGFVETTSKVEFHFEGPEGAVFKRGHGMRHGREPESSKVLWQPVYNGGKPAKFRVEARQLKGKVAVQEWNVTVTAAPLELGNIENHILEAGTVYRQVIKFTKGSGEIEMTLTGVPASMMISPQSNEIVWVAAYDPKKTEYAPKLVATRGRQSVTKTWKLTVKPPPQATVQCNSAPPREPCCAPSLKVRCNHVAQKDAKGRDIIALTFAKSPFSAPSRHHVLKLPGPTPAQSNGPPAYQVLAGCRNNPDKIGIALAHDPACKRKKEERSYVASVGSLTKELKWKTVIGPTETDKEWGVSFSALADPQDTTSSSLMVLRDAEVLARLNPFRWKKLKKNTFRVAVKDVENKNAIVKAKDGTPLEVDVEAYPDVRWAVSATITRGATKKEGAKLDISEFPPKFEVHKDEAGEADAKTISDPGWTIGGSAQCVFDDYKFDLQATLLQNLQNAVPFLKTLDLAAEFLKEVSKAMPVGMSVGLRMPSLTAYVAAQPYEQDKTALVGYEWKLGFYAAPLIGIQIEWNLVYFILNFIPGGSGVVVILQALRHGVGVQGAARVKVDVGIYLIAGGEVGLGLEWAVRPDGDKQQGEVDGRVDFSIEGRCEAEAEAFVVSAGAGVKVGAKTAFGLCGRAAHAGDGTGLAFQGQARWEGIVLYATAYYRAGLKIGPFKRGHDKTKEQTYVLCNAHYLPKAPKPHFVGGGP